MRLAGIRFTHVPYQGWAHSGPALMGGHIEAIVAQPGEAKPQVDGRKMRALMVFQSSRHPAFPDAPTAKELGWDVANGVWFMLVAAKGTPAPAVKYIHDATKAAIEDPAFVAAIDCGDDGIHDGGLCDGIRRPSSARRLTDSPCWR